MATLDHRPVLEDGRHLDGFKTDVQGRKDHQDLASQTKALSAPIAGRSTLR